MKKDLQVEERTNQIIKNYMTHAEKYILENKKDFSSMSTIYHKFIKKDKVDPAFDYTKEIIKRLERDKLSSQTAMQIAEVLMPAMQGIKKDVLIMGIPMVIGLLGLITLSLLLIFSTPLSFSNPYVIGYVAGIFISSILFGFGFMQRTKVKLKTLTNMMLFQACTAYGAAKMQGQGSFGAFRLLEEMKTKQGKELQIRVNQPKVMYK